MASARAVFLLLGLLSTLGAQGLQVKPSKSLLHAGRSQGKPSVSTPARRSLVVPAETSPTAAEASFASSANGFTVKLEKDLLGLEKGKGKVDPEKVSSADQAKLKEAFIPSCTAKLEDLFDKYYARAQHQGPEGEYQMGHTLATHFSFNCNNSYPIEPLTCNTLSASLQTLINEHKPIVIPNITVNGTQITAGACFDSLWPNNTGIEGTVVEGKRLVVYDVNVSRCFGDVFVHYASPDPSIGTPFLPMSAQDGSPVHTYLATVLPLEDVNLYSTRVGECAKAPTTATWNLTFSVAAIHRPNGTCPEGGAAPAAAFLQKHRQDPPPPPGLAKADAEAPAYSDGEEWCGAFFDEYAKALAAQKK